MISNFVTVNSIKMKTLLMNEKRGKEGNVIEKTKNSLKWKSFDELHCEMKSSGHVMLHDDAIKFNHLIFQKGDSISLLEDGKILLKGKNTYFLEGMINILKIRKVNDFRLLWFNSDKEKVIGSRIPFSSHQRFQGHGFPICSVIFKPEKDTKVELKIKINFELKSEEGNEETEEDIYKEINKVFQSHAIVKVI